MPPSQSALPERYRDDRLHAMAIDPQRIFIYWDEGAAVSAIVARHLAAGWEQAPRGLRVRLAEGDVRLLPCEAASGSVYVGGLQAGAPCRVEYGVEWQGRFLPLYETRVQLPGVRSKRPASVELSERISSYTLYTRS
ncbi:MAG TPA: DUF4912 domain-containing protein [Bacilli bacterium]|nr:DUF4912 domain-containing protein [Bacilli bacterium]